MKDDINPEMRSFTPEDYDRIFRAQSTYDDPDDYEHAVILEALRIAGDVARVGVIEEACESMRDAEPAVIRRALMRS